MDPRRPFEERLTHLIHRDALVPRPPLSLMGRCEPIAPERLEAASYGDDPFTRHRAEGLHAT